MTDSQRRGLHVLAVDDEEPAVQQMRWLLEADPLVADVETAISVAEANDVLRRRRIDVVLLDIHMPGTNGMELAPEQHRQDSSETPHVVFVTPDSRPTVHAFGLDALYYFPKPLRPARPHDALGNTRNRVDPGPLMQVPDQGRIAVHQGSQQFLIPIRSIRWAQAQGDYARIHTADDSYPIRISLAGIEGEWAAYDF